MISSHPADLCASLGSSVMILIASTCRLCKATSQSLTDVNYFYDSQFPWGAWTPLRLQAKRHPGLCMHAQSLSRVWLSDTLWTVALQAPLSMGFPRKSYWSGLPFPSPGDLPDPGIEPVSPMSPALQANSLPVPLIIFFFLISNCSFLWLYITVFHFKSKR